MPTVKTEFQAAFKASMVKVMEHVNEAKNIANAETVTRIAEDTPVLTGKFRANWNASLNSPDLSTSSNTSYSAQQIQNVAMKAKLKDVFYLADGLPYGRLLEFYGWSRKAPNGMVRINLKQYQSVLNDAIKEVGGK